MLESIMRDTASLEMWYLNPDFGRILVLDSTDHLCYNIFVKSDMGTGTWNEKHKNNPNANFVFLKRTRLGDVKTRNSTLAAFSPKLGSLTQFRPHDRILQIIPQEIKSWANYENYLA